jgi:hypothetical protein
VLRQQAGIVLQHIPYKHDAGLIAAPIGYHVMLGHHEEGR